VFINSDLELQVYVAELTDGRNLVSFRGTVPSDLMDWIDDIKSAVHVPYQGPGCDGCTVADGFYNSYLSLAPQIKNALNALGGGTTVVTGHSLGAAMAGLAIFDLYNSGFSVSGPHYTFGQPRDGDSTYASTYASTLGEDIIYRVVHNADVVPHLPTESMGFHHTAREVWYNEDSSSYQVCDGSGEDPNCSDSVLLPISVSDHLHYLNLPISRMCN
jgi:predicted lipase